MLEKEAPKEGNFCVLSGFRNPNGTGVDIIPPTVEGSVLLCEGWATGVSLYEATGCVVSVSVDAGNLRPVLANLLEARPELDYVVAADNDRYKKKGNTGGRSAIKLWEEFGAPYAAPDFREDEELSDWNDFAQARGLSAVKRLLFHKIELFRKSEEYIEEHVYPRFIHVNPDTGKPKGTITNLEALLKCKDIWVGYNEIKKEEIMKIPGRTYCRDNAATAGVAHIASLCAQYGLPKGDLDLFLTEIASRHIVNPVRDYILSEPWDGQNRLQLVYDSICADVDFPRAFKETLIRRWLLAGVAAAFSRGDFRCRGVLVFQGGQGIGKSTWFRTITGNSEWFGDGQSVNPSQKDDVMPAIRCWIVELGELEGTMRKSDISKLKTFLAASTDDIRVPYGRRVSAFSRRTIFCGTVNQREFLMDITGSSRFWCIPTARIDMLDAGMIQQVWAEVYERYFLLHLEHKDDVRFQWWLTKDEEEELKRRNEEFEATDPVEENIKTKLNWEAMDATWEWRTCTEVLVACGYPLQSITRPMTMKTSEILTKLTGNKSVRRGIKGSRMFRVPPEITNTSNLYHV
ncbi:MAG: VapE family protein [Cloacibacillus sp.]